jgi:UDP-glucose 4-epimerase
MEVIKTSEKITQNQIVFEINPRRIGDTGVVLAKSRLAQEKLLWSPVHSSLENIVRSSAWDWHR